MKPLEQLINVEKANLLHQLFPSEIPALLQFVQGMCETITEHETQQRENWNNGLFSFKFWLSLVNETERLIKKHGNKLHHSSRLFSDQLFDGYLAAYMTHCLVIYTTQRVHPNAKFSKAVDLLFNA